MQFDPDRQTIASLSDDSARKFLALLIDYAGDTHNGTLASCALELCDELSKRQLSEFYSRSLDYYRANTRACLYSNKLTDIDALWS